MYFSHTALTATALQPSALEARPTVDTLPTDRRPDSVDCQKLQQQIAALARSYLCMHGGGHHGHIYVICRNGTNDYHVLTNGAVAAIVPMHPGAPPQFAPGTTGVLMANARNQYDYDLLIFQAHEKAHSELKVVLLRACHTYVEALRHPHLQFNNVTCSQIMAHMFDTYGTVTDDTLRKNEERLNKPFDPDNQQIEVLFNRLTHCQQMAQGADPISDRRLVCKGIEAIENSGKLSESLRKWKTRTAADQTWQHFRPFWTIEYQAYVNSPEYQQPVTTGQAGYNAVDVNQARQEANKICAYCWTHGLSFDLTHTSATCKRKADGHKDEATMFNMMGGNNRIRRAKGEKPVYKPPFNPRNKENNGSNGNKE